MWSKDPQGIIRDFPRGPRSPPFSKDISMWSQIFWIYFNLNKISRRLNAVLISNMINIYRWDPHKQKLFKVLICFLRECKLVKPLWKIICRLLWKTKNRISTWSRNPHIFRKDENSHSKRYMHPSVHVILFTIAKTGKQPKCPSKDE